MKKISYFVFVVVMLFVFSMSVFAKEVIIITLIVLVVRALTKKISFMNSLYIIPFFISFIATTFIYGERYAGCRAEGDCLYDFDIFSGRGTLYSNTGKYIKGGYYIKYQGEDGYDSGYYEINDRIRYSDICTATGGPYFWFIESVENELDSYRSNDDYKYYSLCYSFIVYNKSGNIIDTSEFYINYKYNESDKEYMYNYETYDSDELEDIIKSDIENKINNYITKIARSRNNESLNNNSNSNKSSSTSTKQAPSKKPKTRTISEPVQEWRDCTSCLGSGLCQYCGGSGVIYYPNGPQQCAACGGFGRCSICAGRGGEYHVEYVQRTETYYE